MKNVLKLQKRAGKRHQGLGDYLSIISNYSVYGVDILVQESKVKEARALIEEWQQTADSDNDEVADDFLH